MKEIRQAKSKITESELSKLIDEWFKTVKVTDKNFYCSNPVAKILKFHLKTWGNWRTHPRGKHSKGKTLNERIDNFKFKYVQDKVIKDLIRRGEYDEDDDWSDLKRNPPEK